MPVSQVFIDAAALQEIEIPFVNVSSVLVDHTFPHRPTVIVCDSSGNLIQADVSYSGLRITVTFCSSISGSIFIR